MVPSYGTLSDLRRHLIRHPQVSYCIQECARNVSRKDFVVSLLSLLLGTAGQVVAATHAPLTFPLFLMLQLVGVAGFSSLRHESWHGRADPNKTMNAFISEWVIAPLFLGEFRLAARSHVLHHRHFGATEDPDNWVWHQSEGQYKRAQLKRMLIIPAFLERTVATIVGKSARPIPSLQANEEGVMPLFRIIIVHGIWLFSLFQFSLSAVTFGYIIPLAFGAMLVNAREYREHAFLESGSLVVYDVLCSEPERLLVAGGYFNLHALHHLFPEIPQRQLPKLYSVIVQHFDINSEYYGASPQISMRKSYFELPDNKFKA